MKNNPKIDFYRTNAVHTVLNRYQFNENEQKIVEEAILTSKCNIPNMKAIEKADALLKMISSSREPIHKEEDIDDKSIAKAVAQTNMKKYKAPQSAWTKPIESNKSSYSLQFRVMGAFVLIAIVSYLTKHNDGYTINEARQACQEKNEVLPLTIDDFIDSNYNFRQPSFFWLADGKVMMSNTWEKKDATNKEGYSFICVSENGHKGKYAKIYSGIRY